MRNLASPQDLAARAALLASRGLREPGGERLILGLFEGDELVATGSRVGDTLQGFAVKSTHDGEGLLARLVTELLNEALAEPSLPNVRVFTKTDTAHTFAALGFAEVMRTPHVTLLEWRRVFQAHVAGLEKLASSLSPVEGVGAVVMNANPVTRGHMHLVKTAAAECGRLFVFVVEEERSVFPFAARLNMVKAAVSAMADNMADESKIVVVPGGPYIISSATFPSYFLRDESLVAVHAELDLRLFAVQARAMGIRRRFAGEEPICPATGAYNAAMRRLLPPLGVEVTVVPRLEAGGEAVSASRVRALLGAGREDEALALMPEAAHGELLRVLPAVLPRLQGC